MERSDRSVDQGLQTSNEASTTFAFESLFWISKFVLRDRILKLISNVKGA